MNKLLRTKEHRDVEIDDSVIEQLDFDSNHPEKYLGLSPGKKLSTSYFIGCKWLIENECAIVVEPKIDNLDYLRMFLHCFNSPITSNILSDIYEIDFNSPRIKLPAETFELTPFIIIHFLNLLKKIVKKGLKKDYIWIEENLLSKIKGKILIAENIKFNFTKGRKERNYCRYQEYSFNCIENKILKKALNLVSRYIINQNFPNKKELMNILYFVKGVFDSIEDSKITATDFKLVKKNNIYREYNEAIEVAKMIFKLLDYSIEHESIEEKTEFLFPPFHIDMSLLFELYVYSLLYKTFGSKIKYQYRGKYGRVDFLDIENQTIIDTKYKEEYAKGGYEIDDIRQLSGYSRDVNVIKKAGFDISKEVPVLDCVIVYPDQEKGLEDIDKEKFINHTDKIEQYYKFYKFGIKLPVKESN